MPISPAAGRANRCRTAWDHWWNYEPHNWAATLDAELNGCQPLREVGIELKAIWAGRAEVTLDEMLSTIRARTAAYYELLWATCSRTEKLVLIQLAQEGFVTRQSCDVVASLAATGIIVERPVPALFNRTFRDFLLDIERSDVVQEWERGEGHGLWQVSGRLIFSSLIAGVLFYLLTQDVAVQSLLPIVSGTGVFAVPVVRTLLARFSTRGTGTTA